MAIPLSRSNNALEGMLERFAEHLADVVSDRIAARLQPPRADPPPVDKTERYLKPEEVAALLQVNVAYVYRHKTQLGGVKLGKYLRFPESTVRRRLERGR